MAASVQPRSFRRFLSIPCHSITPFPSFFLMIFRRDDRNAKFSSNYWFTPRGQTSTFLAHLSRLSISISRRRTASLLSWAAIALPRYSLLASFLSRLTRLNNCRLSGWSISSFRWEIGRVWMISWSSGIRCSLSLREILSSLVLGRPIDFPAVYRERRIVESLSLLSVMDKHSQFVSFLARLFLLTSCSIYSGVQNRVNNKNF